jgi:hypothetical protein
MAANSAVSGAHEPVVPLGHMALLGAQDRVLDVAPHICATVLLRLQ